MKGTRLQSHPLWGFIDYNRCRLFVFPAVSIRCTNLYAADTSHFAAYSTGVCLPSARCGRRWLQSARHLAQSNRASASVVKISLDNSSSHNLELKLSTIPFCHGAPGSMYSVLVPLSLHHSFITSTMNSLRLSLRIFSGSLRIAVSSSSTIITSCDFNLRETSSAIFFRVYLSNTTNILIGLPSAVQSKIKSSPHTSFLRVDCLRRIPDSADPILRFFRRICATFRPASRQTCRSGL